MKILIFFIIFFLNFNLKTMQIIDYKNPKKNLFGSSWDLITDQVMGGVSKGKFNFINEKNQKFYRLEGKVSTLNNGGFIQFRSKLKINDNSLTKITFKARGTGDDYYIHIRTPYTLLPWQYYSASFKTSKEWDLIEIPISNFKKSHKLQPMNFSSNEIKTIGFVAFGKDFEAKLDIADIQLN